MGTIFGSYLSTQNDQMRYLIYIFTLLVCLPCVSITISDTPVVGGWTHNVDAAVEASNSRHIPLVLIMSKQGCTLCAKFKATIFSSSAFQDHVRRRGYIGVYVYGKDGDWDDYKKMRVLMPGGGTLPFMSLYWKQGDGMELETSSIRIHADYNNSPIWFNNWMEKYLIRYDPSDTTTPDTSDPAQTITTTNVVTRLGSQYISIAHPDHLTEGEQSYLYFRRTGNTENDLTIHVVTNGYWLTNVRWKGSDESTKRVPIEINPTDEFDHARKITISVSTLDKSVKLSQ